MYRIYAKIVNILDDEMIFEVFIYLISKTARCSYLLLWVRGRTVVYRGDHPRVKSRGRRVFEMTRYPYEAARAAAVGSLVYL
jgi:hypothetical protein